MPLESSSAPQASASASRFGSRAVSPAARSTASIDEKKTMSPLTCSRAAQLPCTASGSREDGTGFSRRAVRRAAGGAEPGRRRPVSRAESACRP